MRKMKMKAMIKKNEKPVVKANEKLKNMKVGKKLFLQPECLNKEV